MDASTTIHGTRSAYEYQLSINISCTCTGVPLPTVRWTYNGLDEIPFSHTDVSVDYGVRVTGNELGRRATLTSLGTAASTLHLMNIRYPQDQGVYQCIGSNTGTSITATSNASFTLRIEV